MLSLDLERIQQAIESVSIHTPSILTDNDNNCKVFNPKARISLVQVNHTSLSDYTIGKIYMNINPETEIALDQNYQFSVFNFYRESHDEIIYSYDANGNKVGEYSIDREVLSEVCDRTYMTKSNGDVYHPSYRISDNPLVEQIRQAWGDRLLCYSLKQDGRLSFYIIINHEIETQVTESNFIEE
jgi:hypothetical protein